MGLKFGAMMVDLAAGCVWGDLAHCPRTDLMESARTLAPVAVALRALAGPKARIWGIGKAYNDDCYVYTTSRSWQVPTPHPGPFVGGIRQPRWQAIHGPQTFPLSFTLVGHLDCEHEYGCLCAVPG